MRNVRHSAGVTIVELIVASAILALLAAVALPAVQQGRATARKTTCKNNLHQIGIAEHQEVESSGKFATKPSDPLERIAIALGSKGFNAHLGNPLFFCPADHVAMSQLNRSLSHRNRVPSYLVNSGSLFREYGGNGLWDSRMDFSPRDVTDGLSQTAMFSERLIGLNDVWGYTEEDLQREPWRYSWYLPQIVSDREALVHACVNDATHVHPQVSWHVAYSHIVEPLHRSCWNSPYDPDGVMDNFPLVPATSEHPGGVNVLFADGHVSFISGTIDRTAWRALGSRNENDAVGEAY